jgi:hypothetical protein
VFGDAGVQQQHVHRAVRALALAVGLVATSALADDAEELTGRYRAVTLNPNERREMHAKGLDRVTAASGACIEEGLSADNPDTLFMQANCPGVRTSIAWLQHNVRVHILICVESEDREKAQVKLRQKAQKELKAWRGITPCVRGNEVHLLGWAATPAERTTLGAMAKKLGLVDKVELLGEEERHE